MSDEAFAVWVTGPGRASVETIAGVLARHGITTIVALPAGRAAREQVRRQVERLIEVHVDEAGASAVPSYEPPEHPEVELRVSEEGPGAGIERTLCTLEVLGLLAPEAERGYSEAEERDVIRRLKAFGYL